MNANYSEYTLADLDSDGNKDIFLIRFDAEQAQGVAELYRFRDGQMAREPEAQLTAGVQSVRRIVVGDLTRNVPAVFTAGVYPEEGIVDGCVCVPWRSFQNVTLADEDRAVQTVRNYYVYSNGYRRPTDSSSCRSWCRCPTGQRCRRHDGRPA